MDLDQITTVAQRLNIIAQRLNIRLTAAEEGTEIYQCWADRVALACAAWLDGDSDVLNAWVAEANAYAAAHTALAEKETEMQIRYDTSPNGGMPHMVFECKDDALCALAAVMQGVEPGDDDTYVVEKHEASTGYVIASYDADGFIGLL